MLIIIVKCVWSQLSINIMSVVIPLKTFFRLRIKKGDPKILSSFLVIHPLEKNDNGMDWNDVFVEIEPKKK